MKKIPAVLFRLLHRWAAPSKIGADYTMPAPLQLPPSPPAADGLAAEIPKTIWTYWNQSGLDPFVQQCVDSWRRQCPDHQVIVVTPENLGQYVACGDLPAAFAELHPTKQSDWLRLYLVAHHGGYWFDATTLLTAPLDWMGGPPRADGAARAGAVVDDQLLAQVLGHALRHHARHEVGGAAGRKGHDQAHRVRGPGRLALCHGGQGDGASQGTGCSHDGAAWK